MFCNNSLCRTGLLNWLFMLWRHLHIHHLLLPHAALWVFSLALYVHKCLLNILGGLLLRVVTCPGEMLRLHWAGPLFPCSVVASCLLSTSYLRPRGCVKIFTPSHRHVHGWGWDASIKVSMQMALSRLKRVFRSVVLKVRSPCYNSKALVDLFAI